MCYLILLSTSTDCVAMSYHDQEQNIKPADGSSKSPGQGPASVVAGDALPDFERMQPWGPQDILPEDYPEIDPNYLRPDLVSPVALPPSQSGIPPEAWMPAEWQRESSGASVVEPNSVVEDNGRTYHGYKEGKYYLPNDAVSIHQRSKAICSGSSKYTGRTRPPRRSALLQQAYAT